MAFFGGVEVLYKRTLTIASLDIALSLSRSALARLCILLPIYAADDFQEIFSSFTPEIYIYNSTRGVLAYVPAGTNLTLSGNDPTCSRPSQVIAVDLCRVALSIPTSNRSSITFKQWLPRNWTGRFLGTGNGGLDGCKHFQVVLDMANQ